MRTIMDDRRHAYFDASSTMRRGVAAIRLAKEGYSESFVTARVVKERAARRLLLSFFSAASFALALSAFFLYM